MQNTAGKERALQEDVGSDSLFANRLQHPGLISQDINQLKSRETGYGPDESITSNCHIQTAFPPNRLDTAEHLSKLTGQTTIIKEQVTRSGRGLGSQVSTTMHEVQRPLLTPDECLRMPGPQRMNVTLSQRRATWSSIAPASRQSTVVNPFIFKIRPSPSALRFRHQSIATPLPLFPSTMCKSANALPSLTSQIKNARDETFAQFCFLERALS
jgi:Type IV secretory system Conjugative DNA transfer